MAELVDDPGAAGFIQARNYTPVSTNRKIDLIVLHSMEAPEKPGKAHDVCVWFAGATAPKASAHYNVDEARIWQSVRERDIAWAAPGANSNGIHIEHAGYARQVAADWDDVYSASMLDISMRLAARICRRHKIPAVVVSAAQLKAGAARGITTHAAVTEAFRESTHTDPGVGFPLANYVSRVAAILAL